MKRILLVGDSRDYEKFYRDVYLEVLKGTICIVGIVLNSGLGGDTIDGYRILDVGAIITEEYDYIVVMNDTGSMLTKRLVQSLHISPEKIIPIEVFANATFDFIQYIKIKESNLSIIASHCWGICIPFVRFTI